MQIFKKKLISEQLYTQRHNIVYNVIRWHICKNYDIPVQENLWENEPKAITENIKVPLTFDLMIPSGVNIENKALRPDNHTNRCKKKREEGNANWGVNTGDFGLNDAEIKKMTKYQDLKHEVKRSLKLKNAKVVPAMMKNLMEWWRRTS